MGNRDHLFKPGQSGNPKGKPKGITGKQAMLKKIALQLQKTKELSGEGPISYEDAVVESLVSAAAAGYQWAIKLLLQYKIGLPIARDKTSENEELPVKIVFGKEDINL